ncbi:tRNA 4-thiouridine(8) synthase ThiI, partial [Escherichia coli]|nr:tRNA 4-thiouridine(8) synthase ThiI [Escherichia coli]
VKPHPEIFVKSESVRKRFTKILESNIRNIIKKRSTGVAVFNRRDHIEVSANSDQFFQQTLEILTTTPGIQQVLQVKQSTFTDMHDIYLQVLETSRE